MANFVSRNPVDVRRRAEAIQKATEAREKLVAERKAKISTRQRVITSPEGERVIITEKSSGDVVVTGTQTVQTGQKQAVQATVTPQGEIKQQTTRRLQTQATTQKQSISPLQTRETPLTRQPIDQRQTTRTPFSPQSKVFPVKSSVTYQEYKRTGPKQPALKSEIREARPPSFFRSTTATVKEKAKDIGRTTVTNIKTAGPVRDIRKLFREAPDVAFAAVTLGAGPFLSAAGKVVGSGVGVVTSAGGVAATKVATKVLPQLTPRGTQIAAGVGGLTAGTGATVAASTGVAITGRELGARTAPKEQREVISRVGKTQFRNIVSETLSGDQERFSSKGIEKQREQFREQELLKLERDKSFKELSLQQQEQILQQEVRKREAGLTIKAATFAGATGRGIVSNVAGLQAFTLDRPKFRKELRQRFQEKGLKGRELELAVKAGERQANVVFASEAAGILTANIFSEAVGQTLVTSAFSKPSTVKAGEAAFKVGSVVGKRTAIAGVGEGIADVTVMAVARGRPQDITLKKVALYGAFGGVTGGLFGGLVSGTAAAKRPAVRSLGKVLNLGLNIADPFEKPGDIGEQVFRGGFTRLTGIKTFTPTITTSKKGRTKILSLTPTPVKTPVKTKVKSIVKNSQITQQFQRNIIGGFFPSPTPTPVNLPVPVTTKTPVKTPVKTPTNTPVNPFTNLFTPTKTPTQVITPTPTPVPVTIPFPHLPIPAPLGLPSGFGGGRGSSRRLKAFRDELAFSEKLFRRIVKR